MNFKSNILKAFIVIALFSILIPVIAAEDVDDSIYTESVEEDVDVVEAVDEVASELSDDEESALATGEDGEELQESDDATDELYEEDPDAVDETEDETESADVQVTVVSQYKKVKVGDLAIFAIQAKNNGPDTAYNVVVNFKFISGDVALTKFVATQGDVDIVNGIWYVGDLEPDEEAILALETKVLSNKDIILMATVVSDTPDDNLNNNMGLCIVEVEENVVSAETEAMPATGNPFALAILALLSMVGVSLRRF